MRLLYLSLSLALMATESLEADYVPLVSSTVPAPLHKNQLQDEDARKLHLLFN